VDAILAPVGDTFAEADVIVVGAGVFGAWTAYHLCNAGKAVILLDAYGAGNSRASSGGESRIIRFGYGPDELYTRMSQRSLEMWLQLFHRIGDPLFHRTGMLWLAHKKDPRTPATRDTLSRLGIEHEALSRKQTAARFPQFSLRDVEWSLFEPHAGMILARRGVQAVVGEAIDKGVQYCLGRAAKLSGSRRLKSVTTANGQKFRADAFVFACGPWLPKIFPRELGKVIVPSRQEVFFFGAPGGDSRYAPPAMPAWYHFVDEVYGVPDLENRGPKIARDAHGRQMDPDCDSRVVSREGVARIRRYVARRLPELAGAPIVETRVCQYENTSNGDFLLDRHPGFENVWIAGGGSGHGFKNGPAVGEYVAGLVLADGRVEPRFQIFGRPAFRRRSVY